MYCPGCKNGLQYNWVFCPFCGQKFEAVAPSAKDTRVGSYGHGIRSQIMELAVRHAIAGLPWKEQCAAAMKANQISIEEVEAEVLRRMAMGKVKIFQIDTPQTPGYPRPATWTPMK
jgi:hypothetical protein